VKIKATAAAISSGATFRAFSTVERRLSKGVMETYPLPLVWLAMVGQVCFYEQKTLPMYQSKMSSPVVCIEQLCSRCRRIPVLEGCRAFWRCSRSHILVAEGEAWYRDFAKRASGSAGGAARGGGVSFLRDDIARDSLVSICRLRERVLGV
jgi:hypothetical protein